MITPLWISHTNKWQKIYTVTLLTIFTLKGCENLNSIVAILHKSCRYFVVPCSVAACRLTALRSACMHSVTELITYLTTNPVWLSFFIFFAQISRQIAKNTVDSHQELVDLTIFSFFVLGKLNFDTYILAIC